MKNIVIIAIILIILAVVAYATMRPRTSDTTSSTPSTEQVAPSDATGTSTAQNPSAPTGTEFSPVVNASFNVTGNNFKFDVAQMKVKKGDKIKINFTNSEGLHDLVIDEFNAATPQIRAGETASITFTADKTGTFEYYCSVGQHRQMGMVGKLIVEE